VVRTSWPTARQAAFGPDDRQNCLTTYCQAGNSTIRRRPGLDILTDGEPGADGWIEGI